jgi:hypothetical protein
MSIIIDIILLSLAISSISYEIANSELKRYVMLDRKNRVIMLLSKYNTYKKLLGTFHFICMPCSILLLLVANLQLLLVKLFSCPWCLSFWSSIALSVILAYSFQSSLVIAGLGMFFTTVNNFIRMKSL